MPDPFAPQPDNPVLDSATPEDAVRRPNGNGQPPPVELYGESEGTESERQLATPSGYRRRDTWEEWGERAPVWVQVSPGRARDRVWLHVLLLALTAVTTTFAGIGHWLSFSADFNGSAFSASQILTFYARNWYLGFWYSGTILLILGSHELGHYFACRYYGVDASMPYFLPVPPPVETGTLGAFIRIRRPITRKRQLFDIGIAGPLAGFVFAVPTLFIGIAISHIARVPPDFSGFDLGEPLLFQMATRLLWGRVPAGYSLNMHPMAFAAWFGLLATALNLFPIGQLDGGHISYAVLRKHSTKVTFAALAALLVLNLILALAYSTPALLLFTVLIVVMLAVFGPRHPPVMDEDAPLGSARLVLAIVALIVFILCFTPVPIRPV